MTQEEKDKLEILAGKKGMSLSSLFPHGVVCLYSKSKCKGLRLDCSYDAKIIEYRIVNWRQR